MKRTGALLAGFLLVAASCGGSNSVDTSEDGAEQTTTTTAISDNSSSGVKEVTKLVYHSDEVGDWTLRVFDPDEPGPSPLVVLLPWTQGVAYAGEELAQRGAVVVVADKWARREASSNPTVVLNGEMDRAACVLGWAQKHGAEYGADATATTVVGYSGGALPAAWVGLGLADDSACADKVVHQPVGLVLGESQFLWHHERWDPAFESGDEGAIATIDGLINPDNWDISPDLRVGLWSAARPLAEIRAIDNPPGDDSWIWSRDEASPFMDDFSTVGAFDDNQIDWADNANLMFLRMQRAGIDVRNEVYDVGHRYEDPVYDLIVSVMS